MFGLNEIIVLLLSIIDGGKKVFNPYFLLLILPFFFPALKEQHKNSIADYPATYKNYFEIATWCKNNTPKDVDISCRKPELFHLFAERYVTRYINSADGKVLLKGLLEQKVDYVVVDHFAYDYSTPKYLVPAVQKNADKFNIVLHLRHPDTYLLKFKR